MSERQPLSFEFARGVFLSFSAGFVGVSILAALSIDHPAVLAALLGLLVAVGVSPACLYLVHAARDRSPGAVPGWAEPSIRQAATIAAHLRSLALRAGDGAVGDHLTTLANSASDYVDTMTDTVQQVAALGESAEMTEDLAQMVNKLRALAAAADRLVASQRQQTQLTPIDELIESTTSLTAALDEVTDHDGA